MLSSPSTRGPRRRPGHRMRGVVAVGALALGLASCSTASSSSSAASSSSGSATAPTTLRIATSFAIDNLDPLQNGYWAPEFGYSDLLMRPVRGGTVVPWVLQKLTAKSATVWELTLRPNVTFQDGAKLDAAALAALIEFNAGQELTGKIALGGATAKATGDLTVDVTTATPTPDMPELLADESIVPLFDLTAYRAHEKDTAGLVAAKIYVGPYTVDSLTGQKMTLSPTAHYYGGTPPLKSLTVSFVPDAQARIEAVEAGEADIALYPPTTAARTLAGNTTATFLTAPKGSGSGGPQLFVNTRSGAVADVRVRQAIRDAIDYDQLAEQVMGGLYDVSTGLYPSYVPFAAGGLTTDVAAANTLLDQAGWTRSGTGTRTKDGTPLSLTILTYPQQPDVGVIALAVQSQLRQVGIELKIKQVEDVMSAMSQASGWNLGITNNGALGMTGADPVNLLVNYFATGAPDDYDGAKDATLDSMIAKVRQVGADDVEGRNALLKQIQERIVTQQAYSWYLAFKRSPVVVTPAFASYPVPVANQWLTPYS